MKYINKWEKIPFFPLGAKSLTSDQDNICFVNEAHEREDGMTLKWMIVNRE